MSLRSIQRELEFHWDVVVLEISDTSMMRLILKPRLSLAALRCSPHGSPYHSSLHLNQLCSISLFDGHREGALIQSITLLSILHWMSGSLFKAPWSALL